MRPPVKVPSVDPKLLYLSMDFFDEKSEKMKREISLLCKKFFPHIDLKIVLVNKFSLGSLFKYKDRIPPLLRSGLVYQYTCKVPCTSSYIGCTRRCFQTKRRSIALGLVLGLLLLLSQMSATIAKTPTLCVDPSGPTILRFWDVRVTIRSSTF